MGYHLGEVLGNNSKTFLREGAQSSNLFCEKVRHNFDKQHDCCSIKHKHLPILDNKLAVYHTS